MEFGGTQDLPSKERDFVKVPNLPISRFGDLLPVSFLSYSGLASKVQNRTWDNVDLAGALLMVRDKI